MPDTCFDPNQENQLKRLLGGKKDKSMLRVYKSLRFLFRVNLTKYLHSLCVSGIYEGALTCEKDILHCSCVGTSNPTHVSVYASAARSLYLNDGH